MRISTLDFGTIPGEWEFVSADGAKYIQRENLFGRLRFPKTFTDEGMKIIKHGKVKIFEFEETCVINTNPKTLNPYVRMLSSDTTSVGEHCVLLCISNEYQLIQVEKTEGFVHQRINKGKDLTGCFLTINADKKGKIFEACCLKGEEVVKITVTYSSGKVSYTETSMKKVDNLKRDGKWKTAQILPSYYLPCTLAYIVRENGKLQEADIKGLVDNSPISKYVKDIKVLSIPEEYTSDDLEKALTQLKTDGYHAVTLSDITIPVDVWRKHILQNIFTFTDAGKVRAIRTF